MEWVDFDRFVAAEQNEVTYAASIPNNDPQFNEQSNLLSIGLLNDTNSGQRGAWEITRGGPVIVAILDSGVNLNHADLEANIYRNPGESFGEDGFDEDGNGEWVLVRT